MTQTIEQWLMTDWGYTWDRACELVNAHMGDVAKWKAGGWDNRDIAEKLVSLGRTAEAYQYAL